MAHASWLAETQTSREAGSRRRLGSAVGASAALHAGLVLLAIAIFSMQPPPGATAEPTRLDVVYLPMPGPAGGGGGSSRPTPSAPLQVPIHRPPEPTPVEPTPPPPEPPPIPTFEAPVQTNLATVLSGAGLGPVSLGTGDRGRGGGLGRGSGNGLGDGRDGGMGGGPRRPGNGVTEPTLVYSEAPKYTPEAMRAKIQGSVYLEAVVLASGRVGNVRVTRSLDPTFGLDQEAIKAAKLWRFSPATSQGVPVDVYVTLIIDFRVH
jgi:periplasmic protein TonB